MVHEKKIKENDDTIMTTIQARQLQNEKQKKKEKKRSSGSATYKDRSVHKCTVSSGRGCHVYQDSKFLIL